MPEGSGKPKDTQARHGAAKLRRRRAPGLMALEPRLMYDGAAGAAVAAAVAHPHPHNHDQAADASGGGAHHDDATCAPPTTGWSGTAAHGGHAPVTQIVFIDSAVPDYQILAQGVQPGVKVVILNPNSDGVQQIADYLQQHDFQNLDAISIVAHGSNDELELGNALLTAADAPSYSAQLAEIGAALKPGGDILLYGCDVAQSGNDPLLTELSAETGGASIAASSQLVGAAAVGGTWTLDVDTGPITASTPFTAAALAAYPDLLTITTNQIFFDSYNEEDFGTLDSGNLIEQLGVNGTTLDTDSTVISDSSALNVQGTNTSLLETSGVVVDAALGEYFFASNNPLTNAVTIEEGSLSGGGLTTLYTAPFPNAFSTDTTSGNVGTLGGLALDAQTGELYFAQDAEVAATGNVDTADTGIYKISVSGGSATRVTAEDASSTNPLYTNPTYVALDTADNLLFFIDSIPAGDGFAAVNNIDVANLSTGAVSVLNSSEPLQLQGLDIDTATKTLYFTTADFSDDTSTDNSIDKVSYTVSGSGSTASATLGSVTTLYSGSGADTPTDIVIDPQAGIFYSTGYDQYTSSVDGAGVQAAVFEGSLNGGSSLTDVFNIGSVLPAASTTNGDAAYDTNTSQLVLLTTPVVTAGATATVDSGEGGVTADSGLAVTDADGQLLHSATVAVAGNAQSGDTLSIAGDSNFTVSGTTLTFGDHDQLTIAGNNSATLTFTGNATTADYALALDAVSFATTSTDTATRTLDWQVSDGVVSSQIANSTIDVHAPPVVTAGATATFDGGGSAVTLDPTLNVTDASSSTLASATVSIASAGFVSGDTLSVDGQTSGLISGTGISASYDAGTGVLTLTGSASVAEYKTVLDEVQYSFSPSNADPTSGGGDISRTIDWVVNDGALSSTLKTSTLDVVHVAPTVTASGTVTFDGGGGPVTLDSAASVSDPDSGGNLASATVSIGGGTFVSGDTLSVNGATSGTVDGLNVAYDSGTGTLSLTGNASINTYNMVLDEVQYSFSPSNGDPSNGGSQTSRTIDWTANDGSSSNGASNTASSTLDTVHVAPVLTLGTPSVSYTAGGSPTVLDSGLQVSDQDSNESGTTGSSTLASATVTISGGFQSGDELNFTDQNGISGVFNASTGALTLSGTASVADYQTALESVTFSSTASDPTNGGADASRTISWLVNDGSTSNGTASGTTSLGVHVGPLITAGATVTYDSGGTAIPLDSSLTISDGASTTIASATVAISSGALAGDTLSFNNGTNSETFFDGATVTATFGGDALTLTTTTGTSSVADYQAALESVTFSSTASDATNAGADLTRTITWSATDGGGHSGSATSTLDARTPPVVDAGTPSVTFVTGGSAVAADPDITLSDVESTTLDGATVQLTNFQSGDVLGVGSGTGFTVSGSQITFSDHDTVTFSGGSSGTLSLTGTATTADYQAALDAVTFTTSGAGASVLSRTIDWSVADALATSNTAASSLTVHAPPTAGTVTVSGGVEGITPAVLSATFTDSNPGASTSDFSGTINWGDGNTTNFTSADVSENGGVFTVSGPIEQHTYAEEGAYSVSVTITDSGGGSATETGTTNVADAPLTQGTVTVSPSTEEISPATLTATFTDANTNAPTTDFSGTINWGDGNATPFLSNNIVELNPGSFEVTGVAHQYTEAGSYTVSVNILDVGGSMTADTGTATVADAPLTAGTVTVNGGAAGTTAATLSATFSDANTFAPTSDFSGTVDWGDGTAPTNFTSAEVSGVGGSFTVSGLTHLYALSGSYTTTVTIDDVGGSTTTDTGTATVAHVAPTVTAGGTATFDGGGSAVTLDNAAAVTDPDSGGNLASATVAIATGFIAGDTLSVNGVTNGTVDGITVSYNSGTGVLTLSGNASISNYNAALDEVQYSFNPANGDPTGGGGDTSRTIQWSANDGDPGNGASNLAVSTLDTVHVAPTVSAGGTATFDGGGGAVTLDNAATISDPDSGGNLTEAVVSIGTGFVGGDTLSVAGVSNGTVDGVSISYNSGTGVLTLSNSASISTYNTLLDEVQYSFSPANGDPTAGGGDTSRTIDWSATDGSTSNGTSNTATSTVDTVHVAPTLTAGGTATFSSGGSAAVLDGTLTVSDPDSGGNLASATVSIGTGFLSGDTLNFVNTTHISGVYDAATGMLTLSGNDTVADYEAALQSITYSFTGSDPSNGGTDPGRTISWVVNDGSTSNGTSSATTTLVTNGPPPSIVGTAGETAEFVQQQGSAVVLDGAITLSDSDSSTLAGATVSLGNLVTGDTLAADTAGTAITASYDSGTGVLTLSGHDSLADYQQVLQSVTYFSSATDPTGVDATRTVAVDWQVNDGKTTNNLSNIGASSLDVHVRPVVNAGDTVTYTPGGGPVTVDPGVTVTDNDTIPILSATVAITSGLASGDVLTMAGTNFDLLNDGAALTASYSNGTLTITEAAGFNPATSADFQSALQTITFSNTSASPDSLGADPTRTLTWTVNTGLHGQNSEPVTSTVDIPHTPPSVSAGGTADYLSNGATVLDSSLTASDVDSGGNLASATVSIAGGFLAGDTLTANTAGTPIAAIYDATHGVLTLSGSATIAQYQAVLQSVAYSFTGAGGDATAAGADPTRTIDWVVQDGSTNNGTSNTGTSTLDVLHLTAGGTQTYSAGSAAVTLDSGLAITGTDSNPLATATVTIASGFLAGDTLNFTNVSSATEGNISVQSDSNGTLVLTSVGATATEAQWQTALANVTYSSTALDPSSAGADASRTIDWMVTDTNNATSDTATSTLDTPHVAPVASGAGNTDTYTTTSGPVTVDGGLTLSDIDSTTLAGATVTISNGFLAGDTLNFTNTATITGVLSGNTLTLSGTDTLAHYQAALRSITYSFSGVDPTDAGTDLSRTVSFVVNDGSVSNGSSAPVSSTVDTPHLAPVVTTGSGTVVDNSNTPVPAYPFVTVSDADSATLAGATVAIASGFAAGDTLDLNHGANSESFADGKTVTASYTSSGANAGTLLITGTASVADYQQALQSVEFSTATPSAATLTLSWSVNDGSDSNAQSAPAKSALQVQGGGLPPPPPPGPPPAPPPNFGPPLPTFQPPGLPPLPEPPGFVFGPLPSFGPALTLATLAPSAGGGGEFVALLDGIPDVTIAGDRHFDFTIPRDAFIASAGDSGIDFTASLADGDPLPPWLSFDGATGTFIGNPPPGESGVFTIAVTVHDAGGHTAAATFHLSVGQGQAAIEPVPPVPHAALEAAPAARAALAPHDLFAPGRAHLRLAADNDRWHEKDARHHAAFGADARHGAAAFASGDGHEASAGPGEAHPAGKPGLLAQLRAAGRHGFASERQALLDSLHRRAAG